MEQDDRGGAKTMKCPWRTIEEYVFLSNDGGNETSETKNEWAECYEEECPFWEGGLRNKCTRIGSDE